MENTILHSKLFNVFMVIIGIGLFMLGYLALFRVDDYKNNIRLIRYITGPMIIAFLAILIMLTYELYFK